MCLHRGSKTPASQPPASLSTLARARAATCLALPVATPPAGISVPASGSADATSMSIFAAPAACAAWRCAAEAEAMLPRNSTSACKIAEAAHFDDERPARNS